MKTHSFDASDAIASFLAGLVVIAIGLAGGAALVLFEGYAVWLLWGWFAVPNGAPAISIPMAIGIGLLFGTLANTTYVPKDGARRHLANVAMKPVFAIVMGFIVKQFL